MLLVRLYQDVPVGKKPVGIPDDWPAEVQEVDTDAQVPEGFLSMTAAEFDSYRSLKLPAYQAWQEAQELPGLKEAKFAAIDAKTSTLISAGFGFAGKTFSLSSNAQSTYSGLYMIRSESELSFPVTVNTVDDLDTHQLSNPEEVRSFYLSAVATYRSHLDAGTALKNAVRSASTAAEVVAISDTR